jgi:thiol-disulfide isomerase/thioredoxin
MVKKSLSLGKKSLPSLSLFNILLITAVLVLSVYGLQYILGKASKPRAEHFFESSKCSKKYQLLFFHLTNCGYCIEFMPIWNEFAKTENKNVCYVKVDPSDKDKIQSYGVNSFPTVILEEIATKKKVEFKSNRTVDDLKKFVTENAK